MDIPLHNSGQDNRPWGNFKRFTLNEPSTVKIITVEPGQVLSLQTHQHRDEFWYVVSGSGMLTIGEERLPGVANKEYYIPAGVKHRMEAGDEPLVVLEIAFGVFDENDIVRLEDRYGRV